MLSMFSLPRRWLRSYTLAIFAFLSFVLQFFGTMASCPRFSLTYSNNYTFPGHLTTIPIEQRDLGSIFFSLDDLLQPHPIQWSGLVHQPVRFSFQDALARYFGPILLCWDGRSLASLMLPCPPPLPNFPTAQILVLGDANSAEMLDDFQR